jgi:hypothetical protein
LASATGVLVVSAGGVLFGFEASPDCTGVVVALLLMIIV